MATTARVFMIMIMILIITIINLQHLGPIVKPPPRNAGLIHAAGGFSQQDIAHPQAAGVQRLHDASRPERATCPAQITDR